MTQLTGKTHAGISAEVDAQKEYVSRLKKEIFRTDKTNKSKYIQEFHQEFSRFESIGCTDDILIACQVSDIIFIGDYHAVPQFQEYAAWLINEIVRRNSNVVLATEIFYSHNQRLLDRWMEGDISEEEFLKRVRYQQEWGIPWEWYKPIFMLAKEHNIPVYPIDCPPRNQLRHISKRDKFAAEKIVDIFTNNPETKIIVIHGESHLASNHLPKKVDIQLGKKSLQKRKLIIVQNIDEIYWQLAQSGQGEEDVVKIDENRFCVLNISPIVKYEHYLQLIDRWKQVYPDDDDIDLSPTIYHMIDTILKFLKIDKFSFVVPTLNRDNKRLVDVFPEIYSYEDIESFEEVLRSYSLEQSSIEKIIQHAIRHGSCYIPYLNCIFIGEFHINDGGEEATHFVNFGCRGKIYEPFTPTASKSDLFYQHVLEEAIGYFGSKIINPKRNHFRDGLFFKYYRKSRSIIEQKTNYDYEEFMKIVEFIILHKSFELNYQKMDEIPMELYQGLASTGEKYSVLTHELGYFLGEQLYEGFHKGYVSLKRIRKLFCENFDQPLYSLEVYLSLVELLNQQFDFPENIDIKI